MDWIERLLYISPDAGNGSVEFVIYLVLVTVASLVVSVSAGWRLRRTRRR